MGIPGRDTDVQPQMLGFDLLGHEETLTGAKQRNFRCGFIRSLLVTRGWAAGGKSREEAYT